MALSVVAVVVVAAVVTRAVVAAMDRPDADPDLGAEVMVARLVVPVSGAVPGFAEGDPTVWRAEPGPEPRFDTSGLGPDRSLVPGALAPDAVEGMSGAVVHLGDLDGEPMLVYAGEAPLRNPWDYVYAFFMGHGDRRRLCTSLCCSGESGTVDEESGSFSVGPDVAIWLAVPAATSVVAYEIDGTPFGFQQVAGRVSILLITWFSGRQLTVRALAADGRVLWSNDMGGE